MTRLPLLGMLACHTLVSINVPGYGATLSEDALAVMSPTNIP